jgi:hypothetical protein
MDRPIGAADPQLAVSMKPLKKEVRGVLIDAKDGGSGAVEADLPLDW